jgi:hypothetical protein
MAKAAEKTTATEAEAEAAAEAEVEAEEEEEALPMYPDVADISDKHRKGEVGPVILAGAWVQLGSDDDVPEEARGKIGVVTESPWQNAPGTWFEDQEIKGYFFDDEKDFTVKLRDETDGFVTVPADGIVAVSESRGSLQNFA